MFLSEHNCSVNSKSRWLGMTARRAGAAGRDAGDRVRQWQFGRCLSGPFARVPQRPERSRLCRGSERDGRVPLAGRPIRSPPDTDSRSGPPSSGRDRHVSNDPKSNSRLSADSHLMIGDYFLISASCPLGKEHPHSHAARAQTHAACDFNCGCSISPLTTRTHTARWRYAAP
jgi:hypothetical protein